MMTKTAALVTPESLASSGTEHGEQVALFCWAKQNESRYPVLRWLYAVPNGGGRSAAEGAMFKAEGVKRGVSDVCLPVAKSCYTLDGVFKQYHGLYIEMKRKNGTFKDVKPEQDLFLDFVQNQGYYGCVAFGWLQAARTLEWYLDKNC